MTIISYQVLVGDTSNKPIYTLRKSISVHLRIQNYIYIQYVRSSGSGEIWYPFHPATGVETLAACQSHINGTCVPFSLYIYIYRIELLSLWCTHTRCMFLTLIPSFPHGRHTPYVESRSQCIQIGHWSGT